MCSRKLFWMILLAACFFSMQHPSSLFAGENSPQEDASHATVRAGSMKKMSIKFKKNGKLVDGEMYAVDLNSSFPNGKTAQGNVLIIYESDSGLFWWKYQKRAPQGMPSQLFSTTHACLTDDRIVGIESTDVRLWLLESTERYKTFELGLNNLVGRIAQNLVQGKGKTFRKPLHQKNAEVGLSSVLGREFFRIKNTAALPIPANITSVSSVASQCIVGLEGVNQDKAEVTLTTDHRIQTATLNGAVVFSK